MKAMKALPLILGLAIAGPAAHAAEPLPLVRRGLLTSEALAKEVGEVGYGHPARVPEASPRYGAEDFVPTPERPIGIHGDGNGHFPGATLVSEFWDGKPVLGKTEYVSKDPKQKIMKEELVYADQVPKNILWKTALPGWTYAKPIAVNPSAGSGRGGRLYGVGDPDWIWCIDQATGKILWQERLTLASCEPELAGKPEEQKKRQEVYDIGRAASLMDTVFRYYQVKGEWISYTGLTREHAFVGYTMEVYGKMKERLQVVDPDPVLLKACDDSIASIKLYRDQGIDAVVAAKVAGIPTMDYYTTEPTGLLAQAIVNKYKVALRNLWWGYTPMAVSVPASDGERVYFCIGQGQVAAYDLDGKRLWSKRHSSSHKIRVGHWPSPLIIKDLVLIRDPVNNAGGMIAYRSKTGEKVWESKFNHDDSHGIYGSANHLRNPGPDGKGLDLVITWSDKVLRAVDGSAIIEKTPFALTGQRWNSGYTRLAREDRFIVAGGPGEGNGEGAQFRVTWENGQPKVTLCKHFDAPGSGPQDRVFPMQSPCAILLADAPVMLANRTSWDWNTGRVLCDIPGKNQAMQLGTLMNMSSGSSAIGHTVLSIEPGSYAHRQRVNLSVAEPHKMMDISDPRHLRWRSLWNLIGGSEYPSDILFETWLPKADMADFWLRFSHSGLPTWLDGGHCGAQAQGDKTFMQTYKYLYCIGPAVKGTANDDPKLVATIRKIKTMDEVLPYLNNSSAQYRYEAATRIYDLRLPIADLQKDVSSLQSAITNQRSAIGILQSLATGDAYEEIRAAAIQALERAQAGSGKDLLVAQLVAHTEQKYLCLGVEEFMQKGFLAETCRRLGDLGDAALGEALGKVKNPYRIFEVASYNNLCGPQVEKACLATLATVKPGSKDLDVTGCSAAETLAWGGKAVANAAAITTFLEVQLPLWEDGAPNGIVPDAWKPFDDLLTVPAVRPRLIAILGNMLGKTRGNTGPIVLRHIEDLGPEAATMKMQIEALKEKDKSRKDWYDRIIAGMSAK